MAEISQKKLYLILGGILALVVLALATLAVWWTLNPPDPLRDVVISPTKVRANHYIWDGTLHPTPPGNPLDPRYRNGNITWEMQDDPKGRKMVTVEMDEAREYYEPNYEMVHLTPPDYSWQDGEREVRVRWVCLREFVVPADDPSATGRYHETYYKIGDEVTPTTDVPKEVRQRLRFPLHYHIFPGNEIQVILEVKGFVEGELDLGPFLDARSRTSLVNHTGTSWRNGLLLIMGTTKTLHKGPTLAGLDLLSGEPETYEFDPLKQPVLKTPHFEVEYHGFYPGRFRDHSSRGGGDAGRLSNTDYFRFTPTPDEALLKFTLQPSGTGQQVEMELSDGQGYTEETSVWRYRLVRWERPASSLKTARVTYYPKVTRVMVHIPALPGLERNRDVENLLDVKIPLIRIEDHYHWHYAIGALAMMPAYGGSHSHTIPYPLEFRDITLRELIQIYLEYHPDQTVVYDPVKDKLIFMPRPGPQKVWRDTVRWFKHNF